MDEIFLIPFPHIIVYQRAVTVHSSDATATNSTVMCSWWPIHFTILVTKIAIGTSPTTKIDFQSMLLKFSLNLAVNNFLLFITDVKCIGHQEHITVEFVDVVLEEWTITVLG